MPAPGGDRRARIVKGNRLAPDATEPCEPDPAYRPDLPTSKDGMLGYLRAHGAVRDTNALAKAVLQLTAEAYVRPPARAALFEAARDIPGVVVVPDAADGAGRRGVGVSWTHGGGPGMTLVFDRHTYRFLGTNYDAVLTLTIVDRPGQRR